MHLLNIAGTPMEESLLKEGSEIRDHISCTYMYVLMQYYAYELVEL